MIDRRKLLGAATLGAAGLQPPPVVNLPVKATVSPRQLYVAVKRASQ